jgi:maltose phosphorylase
LSPSLVQEENFIGVDFVLAVQQGTAASVDKVVVNDWHKTSDVDSVWTRGLELTRQYAATTFDSALAEHAAFWKKVWDVFDIEIDGDPDVLQGLRFSDFQTYQSYHGENADLNALCKG